MDAQEFQQLVEHIRESFDYSYVGLSAPEIQGLNKRLDSDAYKATAAVVSFFDAKRKGTL